MQAIGSLFHFNATCEMAVANNTNTYTPPAYLKQFENDLELLPVYLATSNDYLLVNQLPSVQYLQQLGKIKPDLPKIDTKINLLKLFKSSEITLSKIAPWGWSPPEHKYLEPFKQFCTTDFLSQPNSQWSIKQKHLYSRENALQVLSNFISNCTFSHQVIDSTLLPQKINNYRQIHALTNLWTHVVVKAPWSSSGRGIIILNKNKIHETYKQWIEGTIKKQGFVMCEPYLNKKYDLSYHFEVHAGKSVDFLGMASFITTNRGQYIGNYIHSLSPQLSAKEKAFLNPDFLNNVAIQLQNSILSNPIFNSYSGVLGVDALVYDLNNTLQINPCLEINLRQNMGTVTLKLQKLVHSASTGIWQIIHFSNPQQLKAFNSEMHKKHPAVIHNEKLKKGYFPLTNPAQNKNYLAFLKIE